MSNITQDGPTLTSASEPVPSTPTASRVSAFVTQRILLFRSLVAVSVTVLAPLLEIMTSTASRPHPLDQSGVGARRGMVAGRFVTSTGTMMCAECPATQTTLTTIPRCAYLATIPSAWGKISTCSAAKIPYLTQHRVWKRTYASAGRI